MGTIDYEQFFLSAKFVARVKIVREIRGALEKDGTTDLAREFGFCTACATQNLDRLSARKRSFVLTLANIRHVYCGF